MGRRTAFIAEFPSGLSEIKLGNRGLVISVSGGKKPPYKLILKNTGIEWLTPRGAQGSGTVAKWDELNAWFKSKAK